jgi:lipid A ethanolaminephosphotransferase
MKITIKPSFVLSLVFFALYCAPTILLDLIKYKSEIVLGILEVSKNAAYILITLFFIFYGLSISRISLIAGSIFIYLTGAIGSYYNIIFGIKITPEIIKVAFHNDITEASELLSIKLIIWNIISVIISTNLSIKFSKEFIFNTKEKILSIFILYGSINFLINPKYKLFEKFQPWQITSSLSKYISNSPKSQITDISKQANYISTKNNRTAVLIIGESARYDHFSLNGYERDTNPILSKKSNLFSFNARSCSNLTYLSVSCLLSRLDNREFDPTKNETSIISIFNKVGFDTSWFGTQTILNYFKDTGGGSFYDEAKTLILPGGSTLYNMNDYDEKMIPFINDAIKKEGNKLIIIHTSGSHWDYANRYPKEFEKFKPICPSPFWGKRDQTDCEIDKLPNIYDNSILYTDYFIGEIINLLDQEEAFVIYTSDHGESLGENGIFGHGGSAPEQFEVPFIFWGSKKFFNAENSLIEHLKEMKNKKINHDYVFHSLLGCSGIKSDSINQELNLCSF